MILERQSLRRNLYVRFPGPARADAIDPVLSGQVLTHLMVPRLEEEHDHTEGMGQRDDTTERGQTI